MRHAYVVSYDISDQRRLKKVFGALYGFGDHIQLSVFRCELSKADLVRMRIAVSTLIKNDEDQILIVDLGPAEGRGRKAIKSIGRACAPRARTPIVV